MSMMHCSLLSLGCAFGFSPPAAQSSLTALRALKIAQRRLRPEVRAKLLTASSARSDDSLAPVAWRFVFSDPATSGHCRIVTVAAKASSEHPDTVEAFSGTKVEDVDSMLPVPQTKLLVDSDQVLEKVRSSAKLRGIKAAEYKLIQPKNGKEPHWHVEFFCGDGKCVACYTVGAKTGAIELMDSELPPQE